jgi:hypothetical protein
MANVFAIHSVGNSIATYLRNAYREHPPGVEMPDCAFEQISSGELVGSGPDGSTRITLYLYRIMVNEHARQQRRAGASSEQRAPLNLDLHYLMTVWAGNALEEQVTMAWAMRRIHEAPVLDASSLSADGGWARDEVVQIIPAELSTEDLMRVWDALDPPYRLSVSYVARVVRLDADAADETLFRPVIAQRMAYGE